MSAGFTPRPRRAPGQSHGYGHDGANLATEIGLLRARIYTVRERGREAFQDGTESYDVACMVIIRLAGLLEREDLATYLTAVTEEERRAIRTTRNIAAHAGYRAMNDGLFWLAVTERVPEILDRIEHGMVR